MQYMISEKDVLKKKSYQNQCKTDKPLGGAIFAPGSYLIKLGRGLIDDATCQI